MNKIYKKARLRFITSNIVYFISITLIVAIFISLRGTNFISALIFSLLSILFFEIAVVLIKFTLYNGQYGVSAEIKDNSVFLKSKEIKIDNILNFSRYTIGYYGTQINIEDLSGQKIKFFSPEAAIFETDLITILREKSKDIDTKDRYFPNRGVIYTVK